MPEPCAIKYQSAWKYIEEGKEKITILDIGARDLSFLYYAPKNKKNYTYESLDITKGKSIKYVRDICKPIKLRKKYDYIVMLDVIEHLENPMQALLNIKKLLKPNGKLILSTANSLSYRRFVKSFLRKRIEHPDHIFSFNKETLTNLLLRAGFKIKSFKYISWIPFLFIPSNEGFFSELILVVCTI